MTSTLTEPEAEKSRPSRLSPQLNQGEHVIVIGPTGSGKSVLARKFLESYAWVTALDAKGELKWSGWKRAKTIEPVQQLEASRIIVAPNPANYLQQSDALFKAIYRQRGWCVYIDEVYSLGHSLSQVPDSFPLLLTRGRSRGITVWTGTQRPRFLPLFCLTESKHFFVFRTHSEDDLRVLARHTSRQLAEVAPTLKRYEFVYFEKLTGTLIKSAPMKGVT